MIAAAPATIRPMPRDGTRRPAVGSTPGASGGKPQGLHAGRKRLVVSKDETSYRRVDLEPPVLQAQHEPTDRGRRSRAHVNQPLDSRLRPGNDKNLTHAVKHALPHIGDTPSAPDPDAVPGMDDAPKLVLFTGVQLAREEQCEGEEFPSAFRRPLVGKLPLEVSHARSIN